MYIEYKSMYISKGEPEQNKLLQRRSRKAFLESNIDLDLHVSNK